jgi:sialic acid synthase SpsE
MKIVKINNIKIGRGTKPFIIAEAGINHNGEIKKALVMVSIAKKAGADAIKFQTFKADQVVANSSLKYSYKSRGKHVTESQMDLFKRCQLTFDDFKKIKKKCNTEKIIFLSTPQNQSDLDLLLKIGIPAIKVGSDDFINIPLLKDFTKTKLPLIISCGMANLSEIQTTLTSIGALNNYPTILMLTTSEYPTSMKNANLLKFKTLSKYFPNVILGYSDHTQNHLAACMAISFGAKVFEKHFTLNKNLSGPDHWFSEDPKSLKNWVSSIRIAYELLGSGELEPTKHELKMRILARRSLVSLKNIKKGDLFDQNNVGMRRPGNGLEPKIFFNLKGKKSKRTISKGIQLKKGDF